jgi:hypothetical protein
VQVSAGLCHAVSRARAALDALYLVKAAWARWGQRGNSRSSLAWLSSCVDTPGMAKCGRPRKEDGKPCQLDVRSPGMACWRHGGPRAPASGSRRTARPRTTSSVPHSPPLRTSPAPRSSVWATAASYAAAPAPPRRQQPPPPPPRRLLERERVKETAAFCADSLSGGWQTAVTDRITGYAQTTWERLSRSRRKPNCKALARIARSILAAKTQIHKAAGKLFGWAAGALGAADPARAFTEELTSNIALPIDAKMIAVARGVQVAGILLCVMEGRDLTECECFIDLALAETKERVNQILVAAMSDWTSLKKFAPGST